MKKVTEYVYEMKEAKKFMKNAETAMYMQLDKMHDDPNAITDYEITVAGHTLVIDPGADNFEAIMSCVREMVKLFEEENKCCDDCKGCNPDGVPNQADVLAMITQILNKDGSFKVKPGETVNGFEVIETAEGQGFGMISLGKRREEEKK